MIQVGVRGTGNGDELHVGERGGARTTIGLPIPSERIRSELTQQKILTGLLSTTAGGTSLAVNGSVTAQSFEVSAETGKIKWVEYIRIVMNDQTLDINTNESRRFGSAAAAPGLTNGLKFQVTQGGEAVDLFVSPVKAIGDFWRYCGNSVNMTTAIQSDKDAISAGVDLLIVSAKLPVPVALPEGTKDKVAMVVQDDLTAVNLFEVQYYGWYETL